MNTDELRKLLNDVAAGRSDVNAALQELAGLPQSSAADPGFTDLGFARIDTDRSRRRGYPETILCEGKTPAQVARIVQVFREQEELVLVSRVQPEHAAAILEVAPNAEHLTDARMMLVGRRRPVDERSGLVCVAAAGTSDVPVAEEAAVTAEVFGRRVERIYDVGVAGLHRTLANLDRLRAARVLVVCAGMDGALPSVIAGLVRAPLIAVPVSTGYGAAFGGLSALLAMLNSCSPGVAVVNIDNGFGAGYLAATISEAPVP